MADPFSVAGGVVGVVSLAITACQGVISYYDSWETQDQKIIDAKGKIERLRSSLSALEEILPKISPSSAIAEHVEQCVLSCGEGIVRLECFVGKCRKDPAPFSLRDKLRACRQKSIFPFRESSLHSLQDIVQDLEGNLNTALQVLQLDTSEAYFRRTSDLINLTKSTAASVSDTGQNISNIEQKVTTVIGALPQIQNGIARLTSDAPSLHSSFTSTQQNMERRLQAIESLASQIMPDFQSKLDRLPLRIAETLADSSILTKSRPSADISGLNTIKSAMSTTINDMDEDVRKLQLVLAQRPSLLRNVCDEAGGLGINVDRMRTMTAQNIIMHNGSKAKWTKQRSFCSCSTLVRERGITYSMGSIKVFKTSIESCKHSRSCPSHTEAEAATTVGLKMTYYGKLLANTVWATISFTTGAGGISISPCLRFRALVSKSSPAFQLLDGEALYARFGIGIGIPSPRETNELCEYFERALQQLYELFQAKAASPTDISEDGDTLITVLCESTRLLGSHGTHAFQSFRILLMGLVAVGVPLNETDVRGSTPLDTLVNAFIFSVTDAIYARQYAQLALGIAAAGAEHSGSWPNTSFIFSMREIEWLSKYNGWACGYNCGALSAAIIRRSEKDIELILQNFPQSIYEQDSQGQSPLHLSWNWPTGITLLLRYGGRAILDRPSDGGFLPLAYSCEDNCLEAVKLMLEADSPLYPPHRVYNFRRGSGVFENAIATSADEIISHLETALVDRRTRLYTLATSKLSRQKLEELKITNDRLLDEKAGKVYVALRKQKTPVPPALRTPSRGQITLFHNEHLTPTLGESLYRRGFIDVDGISSSGLTVLMSMGDDGAIDLISALQRVSWLISKGADPGRRPDQSGCIRHDTSITAAHYICSWIGKAVYRQDRFDQSETKRTGFSRIMDGLEDECQSVLRNLVRTQSYDHCLCACSEYGCTPVVMMLKGITSPGPFVVCPSPFRRRMGMIDWLDDLLSYHHEAWQWLSRDFIRYETFENLALTHTCCIRRNEVYDMRNDMDKTEREEIRDEERLMISKLDALVAEFEEKYTELGVSLPDFMDGYWMTRMEEVESEEEPLDEEEIVKIKDLGVDIYS